MTLEDIWFDCDLEGTIARVNRIRGTDINLGDVLAALALYEDSLMGIPDAASIYDFETTPEYIENLLLTFDFAMVRVYAEHETSIPLELVIQTKAEIKLGGVKWILHKADADPFPSRPHAHDYQNGLKLDLSNGRLYKRMKCEGSIPKKELLEIRRMFETKGVSLPELSFAI